MLCSSRDVTPVFPLSPGDVILDVALSAADDAPPDKFPEVAVSSPSPDTMLVLVFVGAASVAVNRSLVISVEAGCFISVLKFTSDVSRFVVVLRTEVVPPPFVEASAVLVLRTKIVVSSGDPIRSVEFLAEVCAGFSVVTLSGSTELLVLCVTLELPVRPLVEVTGDALVLVLIFVCLSADDDTVASIFVGDISLDIIPLARLVLSVDAVPSGNFVLFDPEIIRLVFVSYDVVPE